MQPAAAPQPAPPPPNQPAPPPGEPPEGTPAAAVSQDYTKQWQDYYAQKQAYDQQQTDYQRQWQAYYAQQNLYQQWQSYYQQQAAYDQQQQQHQQQLQQQAGTQQPQAPAELRGRAAYLAGQQQQQSYQTPAPPGSAPGSAPPAPASTYSWPTQAQAAASASPAQKSYGAYGSYGTTVSSSIRHRGATNSVADQSQGKPPLWVPGAADRAAMRTSAQNSGHVTLESFVQSCFKSCQNADERGKMEGALKQLIGSMDKEQRASRNWAAEPIPSLTTDKKTRWGDDKSSQVSGNTASSATSSWPAGSGFRVDEFGRTVFEPSGTPGTRASKKAKKKQGKKRGLHEVDAVDAFSPGLTTDEMRARHNRNMRFEKMNQGPKRYTFSTDVQREDEIDWDNLDKYTIKGTSTELEKQYYRLTSAPNPECVRPEHVLRQSLQLIKTKWKEKPDYERTVDQLKSVRQDMTVQHIKNDLTVDVYETNARISLENGDINNFNQCLNALKDLYKDGLAGSHSEFAAYRMLYTAFYINSTRGMSKLLHDLGADARRHPAVKHASAVRLAVADGNYVSFFRLMNQAPNMGAYLMELYTPNIRRKALRTICRAYKPTVAASSLQVKLGFDDDEDEAFEEFLEKSGGVIKEGSDPPLVDCKLSEAEFKRLDAEAAELKSQKRF